MSDDLFERLRGWNELAKKAQEAPFPSAVFVHEAVPGLKRQWTSDGKLVLWISPDVIDKLPRYAFTEMPVFPDPTAPPSNIGAIPIYRQ